jgi:hypothetical protein
MRAACVTIAAFAAVLVTGGVAYGADYQIGPVSQQVSPTRASVGASVGVSSSSGGVPGANEVSAESVGEPTLSRSGGEGERESVPSRANGETCQSLPASAIPCYGVVALPPEVAPETVKAPPVNPAVLAAAAANRLSLLAGRIEVSPSARTAGLTGAASWFWLEPPPSPQSLSVSLRGEHVTVSAASTAVRWIFGDGTSVLGGAGVPYREGAAPSGAVRHVYQTRCLPGDQGHDPYVLSSCGSSGYTVRAAVEWGISYQASGPVTAGGSLPSRSTEASASYPVSEARAFLSGGSGR